jgi:ketosteroid isomerase-like protein
MKGYAMKRHSKKAILATCCLALLSLNCTQPQKPDTRAADEAAIRQADEAWSKAAEAMQLDGPTGYFSYLLEDDVMLPPNEPMLIGKEAVRKAMTAFFAMPGFAVKWQPTKVEAASSGDFGYSLGTFELSVNDPKGMPMPDRGKYLAVWKKQPDGSWKVAAESFNSDLPLPQPPSK